MKKNAITLLGLILLSACAFHQTPYVAYEGTHALEDTAVLASFDEHSAKFNDSRIFAVDGKTTSCIEVGCPYWVRVLPGDHKFLVRYTSNFGWNLNGSNYSFANLAVETKEMKPRHVYVLRYQEVDRYVKYVVQDLGERPDFAITLGLQGANQKRYPVQF
jgi:hypothetical protein